MRTCSSIRAIANIHFSSRSEMQIEKRKKDRVSFKVYLLTQYTKLKSYAIVFNVTMRKKLEIAKKIYRNLPHSSIGLLVKIIEHTRASLTIEHVQFAKYDLCSIVYAFKIQSGSIQGHVCGMSQNSPSSNKENCSASILSRVCVCVERVQTSFLDDGWKGCLVVRGPVR